MHPTLYRRILSVEHMWGPAREEGGRERGREGGKEGRREGEKEKGREGGRERGREGERERVGGTRAIVIC